MNVGENIKALCKSKGIPVVRLETDLGLGHGFVRACAVRGTTPRLANIKKIADYFNVPEYVILGEPPKKSGVVIPVLGRVAAGIPISAIENVIGQEEITDDMAAQGEFFALRIKGDSMAPNIHDGDIVVVRQQSDAEDNDIVIAIINGEDGVCKRVQHYADSIALLSDNPAYPPIICHAEGIDDSPCCIIGKVVELRRSF